MKKIYSFECQHRSANGVCAVVSKMVGREYSPDPRACVHCLSAKPPMDVNNITVGLAYSRSLIEHIEDTSELKKNLHLLKGKQRLTRASHGGGPGTELKKILPDFFQTKGCGCKEYASMMDRWGVQGCEHRIKEITEHLVQESERLGHGLGLAAKVIPESLRRATARKLVAMAIERAGRRIREAASDK
jgi:hypothetical protein